MTAVNDLKEPCELDATFDPPNVWRDASPAAQRPAKLTAVNSSEVGGSSAVLIRRIRVPRVSTDQSAGCQQAPATDLTAVNPRRRHSPAFRLPTAGLRPLTARRSNLAGDYRSSRDFAE